MKLITKILYLLEGFYIASGIYFYILSLWGVTLFFGMLAVAFALLIIWFENPGKGGK